MDERVILAKRAANIKSAVTELASSYEASKSSLNDNETYTQVKHRCMLIEHVYLRSVDLVLRCFSLWCLHLICSIAHKGTETLAGIKLGYK